MIQKYSLEGPASIFKNDKTMIEEELGECFVGYTRCNLEKHPVGFTWGKFNQRQLKMSAVNELEKAFRSEGLQSCRKDTVIPIALGMDWIDVESVVGDIDGMKIGEVPEV